MFICYPFRDNRDSWVSLVLGQRSQGHFEAGCRSRCPSKPFPLWYPPTPRTRSDFRGRFEPGICRLDLMVILPHQWPTSPQYQLQDPTLRFLYQWLFSYFVLGGCRLTLTFTKKFIGHPFVSFPERNTGLARTEFVMRQAIRQPSPNGAGTNTVARRKFGHSENQRDRHQIGWVTTASGIVLPNHV